MSQAKPSPLFGHWNRTGASTRDYKGGTGGFRITRWQLGSHGRALDLERAQAGGFADVLPNWKAEDVIGSPYAVQVPYRLLKAGAYDCTSLQALRTRLARVAVRGRHVQSCQCGSSAPPKKEGMSLMLDFVPNHTAIDCKGPARACVPRALTTGQVRGC